jgi:hypothetical protein
VLNKEKSLHPPSEDMPWHVPTSYSGIVSRVTPWGDLNHDKQKAPARKRRGFLFVAENGEISNLDLIRVIVRIIKLQKDL